MSLTMVSKWIRHRVAGRPFEISYFKNRCWYLKHWSRIYSLCERHQVRQRRWRKCSNSRMRKKHSQLLHCYMWQILDQVRTCSGCYPSTPRNKHALQFLNSNSMFSVQFRSPEFSRNIQSFRLDRLWVLLAMPALSCTPQPPSLA